MKYTVFPYFTPPWCAVITPTLVDRALAITLPHSLSKVYRVRVAAEVARQNKVLFDCNREFYFSFLDSDRLAITAA